MHYLEIETHKSLFFMFSKFVFVWAVSCLTIAISEGKHLGNPHLNLLHHESSQYNGEKHHISLFRPSWVSTENSALFYLGNEFQTYLSIL